MIDTVRIHATCVAVGTCGILLRGPSGSGKSDLALRLMVDGARLVADDRCDLWADDGSLWAAAPKDLEGLLEVRGLGVMRMDRADKAAVHLIVDLLPRQQVPRLPEPRSDSLAGVSLPCLSLHAFDASVVAKLRLAARVPFDPSLCHTGAWTS
ncbi:HPr kinase/phosphorylase [Magnetospira sp. QH-2]|uniref:HPr kinase/phosphorylase n=1 Tax=Magnetospira sp. (strain QH-2) TaxID=1288970 RepID=UPI0005F9B91F|nr:HPr kinase/phosphatase C-terminal domain-containing protein [Magnetospira sp. QH-2]